MAYHVLSRMLLRNIKRYIIYIPILLKSVDGCLTHFASWKDWIPISLCRRYICLLMNYGRSIPGTIISKIR